MSHCKRGAAFVAPAQVVLSRWVADCYESRTGVGFFGNRGELLFGIVIYGVNPILLWACRIERSRDTVIAGGRQTSRLPLAQIPHLDCARHDTLRQAYLTGGFCRKTRGEKKPGGNANRRARVVCGMVTSSVCCLESTRHPLSEGPPRSAGEWLFTTPLAWVQGGWTSHCPGSVRDPWLQWRAVSIFETVTAVMFGQSVVCRLALHLKDSSQQSAV